MQLAEIQKRFPGAEVVAGSVVAFIDGKNVNLGKYIGDDALIASADCLRLIGDSAVMSEETKAAAAAQAEYDNEAPQAPAIARKPKSKNEFNV